MPDDFTHWLDRPHEILPGFRVLVVLTAEQALRLADRLRELSGVREEDVTCG